MITISIILYCLGVISFVFLGGVLFYNAFLVLFWLWKSKYDKSNTEYEYKKIKKHRKPLFIILLMMIAISLGIYLYNISISFESIIGDFESVVNIHVFRYDNKTDANKDIFDKNEIKDILNILNQYPYKKNIPESRFGNVIRMLNGTDSMQLSLNTNGGNKYVSLVITNEGYIYMSETGQTYRITTKDKEELFNNLFKAISRVK